MIKTTRWHPDTCSCIIDYTWDTETSEDDRVHNFSTIVSACEDHQTLSPQENHAHVVHENVSKNMVHHLAKGKAGAADDDAFHHGYKKQGGLRVLHVAFVKKNGQERAIPHITQAEIEAGIAPAMYSHGITLDKKKIPQVNLNGR